MWSVVDYNVCFQSHRNAEIIYTVCIIYEVIVILQPLFLNILDEHIERKIWIENVKPVWFVDVSDGLKKCAPVRISVRMNIHVEFEVRVLVNIVNTPLPVAPDHIKLSSHFACFPEDAEDTKPLHLSDNRNLSGTHVEQLEFAITIMNSGSEGFDSNAHVFWMSQI